MKTALSLILDGKSVFCCCKTRIKLCLEEFLADAFADIQREETDIDISEFVDEVRKAVYEETGYTAAGITPESMGNTEDVHSDKRGTLKEMNKRVDIPGIMRYNMDNNEILKGEAESDGYEQKNPGKKLGWLSDKSEGQPIAELDQVGYTQPQKQDSPHTRRIYRSGVSAEVIESSELTAEQIALKELNRMNGYDFSLDNVSTLVYNISGKSKCL